MSKQVIELKGIAGDLATLIGQAWAIIRNEAIFLQSQGIQKEDIRIWMPIDLQVALRSAMVGGRHNNQHPISEIDGIKVLYGYEAHTMVVSHIRHEVFDIPPKCVVVNILLV